MSSSTTSRPIENRLLAALPRDEYEHLLPKSEPIRLPKYRILFEAGEPMPHAYFLNSGMASMLAITENGETVEITMLGDESFIGVPIIHKAATTFCRVMTQTQADAVRVEAGVLLAEFNRGGKLQDLLLRAAHVIETQMAQAFSCNLFHSNYQRVCRALLVTGDCLHSDAFELTHEDMSIRLGKHRNRISR